MALAIIAAFVVLAVIVIAGDGARTWRRRVDAGIEAEQVAGGLELLRRPLRSRYP